MSMLDAFFNKGFKASKCNTLLKLTIPRIKLLRNRREIQIKQMRRDIAKLLEAGQEATARIRVEHIIREENMMAAQEILELFCELISVRVPIIDTQRECPLDLKEAISSLCFAAPRCADLPELLQVQILFGSKYGKEFVSAATGLMPDCGVNRQLIELLSVRAPAPETKLKLLKEIAEEHDLDWNPAATETEFFKQPEDLLNGPTQFVSGSKLPLPKEKHDEYLQSNPDQDPIEQSDDDTGFDTLDFPEVPKVSLRPSADAASAPAIDPPIPATLHPEVDEHLSKHIGAKHNPLPMQHLEFEELEEERSVPSKYEPPNIPSSVVENKQFLPFVSPPSLSSATLGDDVRVPTGPKLSTDIGSPSTHSAVQNNSPPSLSRSKSEGNVDLQDVLAAAQAAAESAERAAAAARSAASLAQIRITELIKRKNEPDSEIVCETSFPTEILNEPATTGKQHFDHQDSIGSSDGIPNSPDLFHHHESHNIAEVSDMPSFDVPKVDDDTTSPIDHLFQHGPAQHQPQRLPSMDDDSYFSYPNLFSSQGSNLGSGAHSFTNNSRSGGDL